MPEGQALIVRTRETDLPERIQQTTKDVGAGIVYERPTILESLLSSDLSPEDKKPERIVHEIFAVLGATTETTANALTVATYYLLTKPDILAKLTQELKSAISDPGRLPPWTTLEKLPYLDSVLKESSRLSCMPFC